VLAGLLFKFVCALAQDYGVPGFFEEEEDEGKAGGVDDYLDVEDPLRVVLARTVRRRR